MAGDDIAPVTLSDFNSVKCNDGWQLELLLLDVSAPCALLEMPLGKLPALLVLDGGEDTEGPVLASGENVAPVAVIANASGRSAVAVPETKQPALAI